MAERARKVFLSGNAFNFDLLAERLRAAGCELIVGPRATPGIPLEFDGADYPALFGPVEAIVTSSRDRYPGLVFAAAPRLRVVVSPIIGVDNIDLDAATDLAVPVAFGAYEENFIGVAEATVALLVTLLKQLRSKERALRTDGWSRPPYGRLVRGKTVGLVGFGRVGQAVAARLQGWEIRLLVADPYADEAAVRAAGGTLVPLDDLLRQSDVVSLHAALTPETRGLIGEARLRLMKPTAYLVNLARGQLIDQAALARAIEAGAIAGAALDAFAAEPLEPDSPLRRLDPERVILTPHNAGYGEECIAAGLATTVENLTRGLAGRPPLHVANPSVLPAWQERLARLDARA